MTGIARARVGGYAETSIDGGPFQITVSGGSLSLTLSSSFPRGAGTYALPSPDVTIDADALLPASPVYNDERLHVVSGAIVVAAATDDLLDASGSVVLANAVGQTFTVSEIAVHVACAYDQIACQ
jgi:hypothetical protein